MRFAVLSVAIWMLVACHSSDYVIGPQPSSTDACPSMAIQGGYADTINEAQANGHSFVSETKNWEVIAARGMIDARVRGEIDTHVVTADGTAVPITVSVLANVVHPGFVMCTFQDALVQSEIATLDGSSIQSVSGRVSGHFAAGVNPAVINGQYNVRIVFADGRIASHLDSWQAPIM